jgi:hypothetical protein
LAVHQRASDKFGERIEILEKQITRGDEFKNARRVADLEDRVSTLEKGGGGSQLRGAKEIDNPIIGRKPSPKRGSALKNAGKASIGLR